MLWRDLAGRLDGLVYWINHYRNPGQVVGRLGERIDPIIEELIRIRQDAQGCGGDDPTDREETIREGIKRADLLNRPGADRGSGGISREGAATVRPNPKLTDRGVPPRRSEGGG